jgi:hypothetical protein
MFFTFHKRLESALPGGRQTSSRAIARLEGEGFGV